jgi:hypothetical protein
LFAACGAAVADGRPKFSSSVSPAQILAKKSVRRKIFSYSASALALLQEAIHRSLMRRSRKRNQMAHHRDVFHRIDTGSTEALSVPCASQQRSRLARRRTSRERSSCVGILAAQRGPFTRAIVESYR